MTSSGDKRVRAVGAVIRPVDDRRPVRLGGVGEVLHLGEHLPRPFGKVGGDLHRAQRAHLDRRAFGGADQRARLVDPDRHRHVGDAEQLVDAVVGIDQRWMGGGGSVDPGLAPWRGRSRGRR